MANGFRTLTNYIAGSLLEAGVNSLNSEEPVAVTLSSCEVMTVAGWPGY